MAKELLNPEIQKLLKNQLYVFFYYGIGLLKNQIPPQIREAWELNRPKTDDINTFVFGNIAQLDPDWSRRGYIVDSTWHTDRLRKLVLSISRQKTIVTYWNELSESAKGQMDTSQINDVLLQTVEVESSLPDQSIIEYLTFLAQLNQVRFLASEKLSFLERQVIEIENQRITTESFLKELTDRHLSLQFESYFGRKQKRKPPALFMP